MILIDWYSPGYKAGGPIQSTVNIVNALNKYYDIYILTSDTDHGESKPYHGIEPNIWIKDLFTGVSIYYTRKLTLKKKQVRSLINEIEPDYIYLNHFFSPYFVVYPIWLLWRDKIKGKIILCPRGALHKSALSEKTYKKLPFLFLFKLLRINKMIQFHATNEKEKNEIEHFFPGSDIYIANNLPDNNQPDLQLVKKSKGELKCLFISRIVPIKNLLYLLKVLENVKDAVRFTIAGPAEDEIYWNLCQEKVKELPRNLSVTYIGSVQKKDVQKLMQEHHLFVLPTTGENFGHAIFEAFLVGRPVLISDRTPWIKLPEKYLGWDIPLDKPHLFTAAIETALTWDQEEFDFFARNSWHFAHRFINDPALVERYKVLFS